MVRRKVLYAVCMYMSDKFRFLDGLFSSRYFAAVIDFSNITKQILSTKLRNETFRYGKICITAIGYLY